MTAIPGTSTVPPRLGIQLYTVRELTGDATFRTRSSNDNPSGKPAEDLPA